MTSARFKRLNSNEKQTPLLSSHAPICIARNVHRTEAPINKGTINVTKEVVHTH
jgi:hypothetical protein